MCLLALAWRLHPDWPLLLAGNRDELHARPTAPAGRWPEAPYVVGGKDLEFGGTWLGVSERGRLGSITNVRNPAELGVRRASRGLLTRGLLLGELDFEALRALDLGAYNAFNLIGVMEGQAFFLGNREGGGLRLLPPGLYGLSNGPLDAPWPKTMKLKGAVSAQLGRPTPDRDALFAALADETVAPDGSLPDTGIGLERERLLSPAFLKGDVYGTRCSTLILVDREGRGRLAERSFGPGGAPGGERVLEFTWPASGIL